MAASAPQKLKCPKCRADTRKVGGDKLSAHTATNGCLLVSTPDARDTRVEA